MQTRKWPLDREVDMTDEKVNRIVRPLCEQLHVALRLKGTGAFPSNTKDLGSTGPRSEPYC
jgi:hypothetical protein